MSSFDASSSLSSNHLSPNHLTRNAGTTANTATNTAANAATNTAAGASVNPSNTAAIPPASEVSTFAQTLQALRSQSSNHSTGVNNPDNTAVLEYMLDAYIQEMMSTFGGSILGAATSGLSQSSPDVSDASLPGVSSSAPAAYALAGSSTLTGASATADATGASTGMSTSSAGPLSSASNASPLSPSELYSVATQATQMAGVPSSWVDSLVKIAMNESSGNPSVVNTGLTGDGEHAIGLMQTEPSTFQAYAAPGHTDITNPLDNMIAAIHYIKSRYGDASVALHRSLNGGY